MQVKKNNLLKFAFQIMIAFCVIYEVQLKGTSTMLTSRKVILFFLFMLFVLKNGIYGRVSIKNTHFKNVVYLFVLGIVIVGYVLIITLINNVIGSANGTAILPRAVYFVLFGPVIWILAKDYYDDYDEFMRALLIATFIQVIIVILQYHVKGFAIFLDGHFELDAHTTYLDAYKAQNNMRRAVGLGAGDSLLSIDIFLGAVSCVYFMYKTKNIIKYLILYMLFLYGTAITGSIGMMLTAFVFFMYYIFQFVVMKKRTAILLTVIIVLAIPLCIFINPSILSEVENSYILSKIYSLFSGNFANSRTMKDISSQVIAPISLNTFCGTGIYRGVSATGIMCTSDFGYVQTYFGYGLVMASLFYLSIFYGMYNAINNIHDKNIKFIMILLAISIAIAEIKEPYMSHYGVLYVFFVGTFSYFNNLPIQKIFKNK